MQQQPVIIFDGICNLCNGWVKFLIRNDRKGIMKFSPLQSEAGQKLLLHYHQDRPADSIVLLEDGRSFVKSTAALRVLAYLPWYWQWARLGWLFPRKFRDAIYDLVARNRFRFFGKKESCMVPTKDILSRFIQ